ncbi:DNA translocase FtsK [Cytobacillus oceanisediminis]|uniref:DNA translocase FtsK n=1 Tax=Cytobacillus oceanisediminis TaxID=665099 RepID=UPI001CCE078A|nr:DNA translocase FtsK [Cytobacillus oceanisediminis]MBQ6448552.1 DNA translocase FtsK [Bacillus sp. (in: firmicutes)]MBZ9533931.1 DNA translocase FtsK [Cytobacillus oceanisediminis]
MNWFKKVFKQFVSEEEELNQVEKTVEIENQPNVESTAWKKEMDSKVLYQYPKGNFRFPLIPDGDEDDRKEVDRKKRREPRQSFVNDQEEINQPFKRQFTEQPKNNFKEEQVSNAYSGNRPFKPTEVVSPIYGYNRPERKETSTTTSRPIIKEPVDGWQKSSVIQSQERQDEVVREIVEVTDALFVTPKAEITEEIAVTSEMEITEEIAATQEVEVTEEIAVTPEAEVTEEIVVTPEMEVTEEIAATQEVEVIEEIAITQEVETTDEIDLVREQATMTMEEHKQESILSPYPEESLDEEEDAHHYNNGDSSLELGKIASPVSLERDWEDNEVDRQIESLVDEQEHNEQPLLRFEETEVKVEETFLQNSEEVVEEKEEKDSSEKTLERKPPTRKGPLPFNVLMLNKDRQSLANKKIEKKVYDEPKPEPKPKVEEIVQPLSEEDEEVYHNLPYYVFPEENLLHPPILQIEKDGWIEEQTMLLNDTFTNFNVHAKVVNVTQGPSVTRYEVQPEPGVKVSKITNLSDDLKLSLAAKDIRIEAPIPGKHTIGIEVPNRNSRPVLIREILESDEFKNSSSPLTVAMGLDISGKPIVTDLRKMPHGLIAGATGSGKSVCINTMLVSLLYKAKPEELKLLLVDPKMVELAPYNYIPHLASPVITDVKTATAALKWAVEEMERRYELLAHVGVRDISKYNQLAEEHKRYSEKLPYLVIIIDELADLMMMAPADVEEAISRIAQKARACGIHLLIATQRPSVDVITGLIKANVPTRIAFSVSSQIDSRTVIDISGAEKLLGKGDMLFLENGTSKPVRLQGTYVSDEEIDQVVAHVRRERKPEYLFEQEELLKKVQMSEEEDELFYEACEFIIEQGGASTSSLQRNFKIGYNRAARLIDMMEKQGFISEARGTKPRDVLITESELLQFQETE